MKNPRDETENTESQQFGNNILWMLCRKSEQFQELVWKYSKGAEQRCQRSSRKVIDSGGYCKNETMIEGDLTASQTDECLSQR